MQQPSLLCTMTQKLKKKIYMRPVVEQQAMYAACQLLNISISDTPADPIMEQIKHATKANNISIIFS